MLIATWVCFLLGILLGPILPAPLYGESLDHKEAIQSLLQEAKKRKLWDDPYWHTLLHYRRNVFLLKKSDISHKEFFLSPKGRVNPKAELEKTIEAFFDPIPEVDTDHPQCRFIARYRWLKETLDFPESVQEASCKKYHYWKDQIDPKSLSLMFSSYYLNNPGSMYGHTLIKINASKSKSQDLLNFTINYAAQITLGGPFYAFMGLGGGYRGNFAVVPFYVKVQQYNNMESRDIWEYQLRLNEKDVSGLFEHLWELQNVRKRYYFLNKNCAYELLPLLDAADPKLGLSHAFRYRTLPVDTLLVVEQTPGLVTKINYRPSHHRQLLHIREQLTPAERSLVKKIALGKTTLPTDKLSVYPEERQAMLLEAAFDLLKFKISFFRNVTKKTKKTEQSILTHRAMLPTSSEKNIVPLPRPVPPHDGHPSGRYGVSLGLIDNGDHDAFQQLDIRPALHDLAEDSAGYISGQLEMFHLKIRHQDKRNKFYLHSFSIVDIAALAPYENWTQPISWKFRTGLEPAYDIRKDPWRTNSLFLSGGPGLSWALTKDKQTKFYALSQLDTAIGKEFDKGYRYGIGGNIGLAYRWNRWVIGHAQVSVLRYPGGHVSNRVREEWQHSVPLGKNQLLRINLIRDNHHKEGLISIHRYF
ncbi:hypothetical protein BVX98_07040 [bacterium F11]|nr:hypothetical protein BVX98_07040 [bacterium F11]